MVGCSRRVCHRAAASAATVSSKPASAGVARSTCEIRSWVCCSRRSAQGLPRCRCPSGAAHPLKILPRGGTGCDVTRPKPTRPHRLWRGSGARPTRTRPHSLRRLLTAHAPARTSSMAISSVWPHQAEEDPVGVPEKNRPGLPEFCRYPRGLCLPGTRSPIALDHFSPHLTAKKDTRTGDWATVGNVERRPPGPGRPDPAHHPAERARRRRTPAAVLRRGTGGPR